MGGCRSEDAWENYGWTAGRSFSWPTVFCSVAGSARSASDSDGECQAHAAGDIYFFPAAPAASGCRRLNWVCGSVMCGVWGTVNVFPDFEKSRGPLVDPFFVFSNTPSVSVLCFSQELPTSLRSASETLGNWRGPPERLAYVGGLIQNSSTGASTVRGESIKFSAIGK